MSRSSLLGPQRAVRPQTEVPGCRYRSIFEEDFRLFPAVHRKRTEKHRDGTERARHIW